MVISKKMKAVTSLITAVLLTLIAVSGHRVYLVMIQKKPLKNQTKVIEANSFQFNAKYFGVAPRNERLVSATKKLSKDKTIIFTSNRESPFLKQFVYQTNLSGSESALNLTKNLSIETLAPIEKKNTNNYFIFDLLVDGDNLLISLVTIPNVRNECNIFQIIKIPIDNGNLTPSNALEIWKPKVCIYTHPNNPGWSDFHGRLAASKSDIYLSTGLLIASTYLGFYPNPNIRGLDQNLAIQLKNDQLFGGVIKINKVTGYSSKVAQGFRGPSGIAIRSTPFGEQIWLGDHGPRGGDELNLVIEGKDYGWPWVSYGTKYFAPTKGQKGILNTKFGAHDGYEKPIHYWTPSIAPSQLIVLSETLDSDNSWSAGDLVISSLKAKSIFRLKLNQNSMIHSIEQVDIGVRIRDISVENRTLFVSTDDGQIVVIEKSGASTSLGAFPAVFPVENPFYFLVPGLNQFSNFIDSLRGRISKLDWLNIL